jgi:hypothetical protein
MGNQREVRQTKPFRVEHGAAIPIRDGQIDAVRDQIGQNVTFYMIPTSSDGYFSFPDLDYEDTTVDRKGDLLCIQSGGKMWCGYEEFVGKVRRIAQFLEYATFYIADEEDCVDRFVVRNGGLDYQRVHQGSWFPLDAYPETRSPTGTSSGSEPLS